MAQEEYYKGFQDGRLDAIWDAIDMVKENKDHGTILGKLLNMKYREEIKSYEKSEDSL